MLGAGGVAVVGGVAGGWTAHEWFGGDTATTTKLAATTVRSSSALSEKALDIAALLAKVEPAVVSVATTITARRGLYTSTGEGAGTGIVLTSSGEILTNAHVIEDATTITVTFADSTRAYETDLVAADTNADIALLKVKNPPAQIVTAELGRSSSLQVGDDVVAIGNALALDGGPTVTKGIVSALDRSIQTDANTTLDGLIQTDAAISSGNSGGPLVNATGQVVGMNTAIATSNSGNTAENIGFAIAIDQARPVIEQLRGGKSASA